MPGGSHVRRRMQVERLCGGGLRDRPGRRLVQLAEEQDQRVSGLPETLLRGRFRHRRRWGVARRTTCYRGERDRLMQVYTTETIARYEHGRENFTQGLVVYDERLTIESTGLYGASRLIY